MLKLDNENRIKIPDDLVKISNFEKNADRIYIMLKGNDLVLTAYKEDCFDGILACTHQDAWYRIAIPKRIVDFLKLNKNREILFYVDSFGYVCMRSINIE